MDPLNNLAIAKLLANWNHQGPAVPETHASNFVMGSLFMGPLKKAASSSVIGRYVNGPVNSTVHPGRPEEVVDTAELYSRYRTNFRALLTGFSLRACWHLIGNWHLYTVGDQLHR